MLQPLAGRGRGLSAVTLPQALLAQLAPDGIMVLPVGGEKRTQRLVRIVMTPQGYTTADIAPVRFVPLVAGLPDAASS